MKNILIGIVAGEASGDFLGAELIKSLNIIHSNIKFVGIAGPLMLKEKNVESWFSIEELSIMGIFEIINRIPKILNIRNKIFNRLSFLKPDLFIGIDSPEFNIHLEFKLKKNGIKIIHYVSPSIWAWRKSRIFKIKESVDKVLALLPFEKKIYDDFNIPCKFVGHPLADKIPLYPDKYSIRSNLEIDKNSVCLALLPGSRLTEINLLSKKFLYAAKIIKKNIFNLKILVPMVNSLLKKRFEEIKREVAPDLPITIFDNFSYEVMACSDFSIVTSGTATLECMLSKCPMVVGYCMKKINFFLLKKIIKINYISLPNLIAGKKIVPEKIQNECNPEVLAKEILIIFNDKKKYKKTKKIFYKLHKKIRCNSSYNAACSASCLINKLTIK
ncbi:lpxB [Wigglesworthia glossinidia endosymbiont of Glossina brevipalpis]|uniref:Lipid-A-disaccharide synthase n=1 Tax=Wigglesworthia glossinidia brevipalpis TaxID=36870 RepID=LPXB_WIGBR|nr:RecName: Full=Lipid-A-disaccharide synthase [Wigglesworthia glossinidia endosymbiont of Glossina brevipalpis]BAC24526.1 lpxB [Wigglesworthia glossinidia endosymbiont of Glossina brevipalpis]